MAVKQLAYETTEGDKLLFYQDAGFFGRWRWTVKARNGRTIDSSHQSFSTAWGAKRNYRRVRDAEFFA